jgi:serine/arginine repetitive matrix protein 2
MMVSGIPPPRNQSQNPTILEDQVSDPSTDIEYSSSSRRNRDLADALFGTLGEDNKDSPSKEAAGNIPIITMDEPAEPAAEPVDPTPQQHDVSGSSSGTEDANSLSPSPPYLRGPGAANTPPDQAELAREVKRKTEAAMAQLRRAPSQSEAQNPGSTRKRVSPNQISSPRLVAATTSVDTIPLRSPSAASGQQTSKITAGIGQGFRRLRGTLRSKPTAPNGNEVTPYPLDLQPPPPVQIARYNQDKLHPGGPGAMSATELGGFKTVANPHQPALAGPTRKGFMARFRKPRLTESPDFDRRAHLQNHSVNTSSSSSPHGTSTPDQIYSAPATHDSFDLHASDRLHPAAFASPKSNPPVAGSQSWDQSTADMSDADQRRKLFEAASKLGVDPTALNDLLSRSTTLTRNNSVATPSRPQPLSNIGTGLDRSKSLTTSSSQSAAIAVTPRNTENVGRKSSFRKRGEQARGAREVGATASAIVRRTIIFPSEQSSTIDLHALMQKNSTARQRGSGSFHSSRSVHDRAPTPPPPRSPTSKRFSHDSPPVPQLPPSRSAQAENTLHVPQSTSTSGPIEKSSSTYDSL